MTEELLTEFEIDLEGMTVPYPPLFDHVRRNHGFEDVRGRPDRASAIPECVKSAALRSLLMTLAAPNSRLFTLGCDLGTKRTRGEDRKPLHLAGGYVQVISARYSNRHPDEYYRLAKAVERAMFEKLAGRAWRLRFVMTPACVNLDGNSRVEPSLWLWFDAAAPKPNLAADSREALLTALLSTLVDPAILLNLELDLGKASF